MANRDIKQWIKLEGEAKYKAALDDIGRQLRVTKSELAAQVSAFKGAEDSMEAMTTKSQMLTQLQEQQEQKVETLTQALEMARNKYGETSHQADDYRVKLAAAQEALNKTEYEQRVLTQRMEEAQSATGSAGKQVEEYDSALKLAQAELKAADSATQGAAKSQETLTGKLQAQQKVYDLQKNKVQALSHQLEAAEKEYGKNSSQAQALRVALNDATAEMNKTGTAIESTSTQLNEYGENTDEAAKKTEDLGKKEQDAEKKSGKLRTTLSSLASAMRTGIVAAAKAAAAAVAAVGAATVAAAKAGFDMAKAAGVYADDLLTLSQQTGVSAESLQKWTYASNFVDTSVDTMTSSMSRMIRSMGDAAGGSKEAQQKFKDLGVAYKNLDGSMRGSEDVFWDCIEALGSIENPAERDAAAMDLFGKSAQELNPLIEAGRKEFERLGAEGKNLGVVFSDEALVAMGSFDDSMQRANASAEGMRNAIGLTLIPVFQPLVDKATRAMATVATALQDGLQPGELEEITGILIGLAKDALESIGTTLAGALPLVGNTLNSIVETLIANLPGAVDVILPQALGLLQTVIDGVAENIDPLIQLAGTIAGSLGGFLIENASTIGGTALQLLLALVDGISEQLPTLVPSAVGMITQLAGSVLDAVPELAAKAPEIVTGLLDGLSTAAETTDWSGLGTKVLDAIGAALEAAAMAVTAAITAIGSTVWGWICDGVAGQEGQDGEELDIGARVIGFILDGLQTAVSGAFTLISTIVGGIWDGIKAGLGISSDSGENGEASGIGQSLLDGFIKGIETGVTGVVDKVKGFFGDILQGIKDQFGIASPSKELENVGGFLLDGLLNSLSSGITAACEAVKKIFGQIWDAIKSIFGFGNNKESEESKEAKGVGEEIMGGMKAGIEGDQDLVTKAITSAAQAAITALKTTFGIQGEGTGSTVGSGVGQSVVKGVADGITAKSVAETFSSPASSAKKAATDALKSAFGINFWGSSASEFEEIGKAVAQGIANGLKDNSSLISSAAKTAAGSALSAAKKELGIKSPSKRGELEVGLMYAEGVAKGIRGGMKHVTDSATELARRGLHSTREALPSARAAAFDNEAMGDAVERANRRAGLGNSIIELDGNVTGRMIEPRVSRNQARRTGATIAGRSNRRLKTI